MKKTKYTKSLQIKAREFDENALREVEAEMANLCMKCPVARNFHHCVDDAARQMGYAIMREIERLSIGATRHEITENVSAGLSKRLHEGLAANLFEIFERACWKLRATNK